MYNRTFKERKYFYKPVNQYDLNHNFIKEWPSAAEIARVLGLNKSHIGEVCRGKAKTCGGFIWKYKDLT